MGVQASYLASFKKPQQKHYSYFKAGLDYEIGFGAGSPLLGLGVFADTGAILFDMCRIGAGIAGNYLSKKDVAAGLVQGFILEPYIETAIMWKAFENSGFDFGFRLAAPVKLTAKIVEPYYAINSMNMLDWKFSLSYFHFFSQKEKTK